MRTVWPSNRLGETHSTVPIFQLPGLASGQINLSWSRKATFSRLLSAQARFRGARKLCSLRRAESLHGGVRRRIGVSQRTC